MQKRMHSREFKLEVMRQIASGSSPGQARSWHSLDEIACRHVRRSVAFSPHLNQAPIEAPRTLFLQDLLARPS